MQNPVVSSPIGTLVPGVHQRLIGLWRPFDFLGGDLIFVSFLDKDRSRVGLT